MCVAAVPECAAFLLRRVPVWGFRGGWGAAVVSVVGLWLGEGVVGVVWSPRVIVVSGMRAPPVSQSSPSVAGLGLGVVRRLRWATGWGVRRGGPGRMWG